MLGVGLSDRPLSYLMLPIDVKVHTERAEDGSYVVTPISGARDATKRMEFKATCSGKAGQIKLHVHAKKGRTIRAAVAKRAQVGIAGPPNAEAGAPVTVTFNPRR